MSVGFFYTMRARSYPDILYVIVSYRFIQTGTVRALYGYANLGVKPEPRYDTV